MPQVTQKVTELRVNGGAVRVAVAGTTPLLEVLRDDVGLTGAKYGCGEGQCGACTVLVDGAPTRSCITAVSAVAGKEITTIEGLAKDGALHPVQQAFLDVEALQCGYCTPGMVLESVALLRQNPKPDRDAIVRGMEGHVCRCGTYARIIAAIEHAARGEVGTLSSQTSGEGARR